MKNILLTTTMAFGLGIAAGPSFAQSQQPDASGGQTVCQPGDPNCPASDSSGAAGGTAGQPLDSQAGDATAPKVDSQAGDATTPKMDSQAGDATAPKVDSQAGDATAPKVDSQAGDATQPTTDGDKTASIGDDEVTAEQKTEVRRVISEVQVEPVELDDIDVDISVGVAVPRTIRVQPLPPRIVEIVPEFEDYVFFVLADGRIIILEPDTYEIVYVLVV